MTSGPLSVIALYERLLTRCSTENQRNAVHIALTNRLTPCELDVLLRYFVEPARTPTNRIRWRYRPPSTLIPAEHTLNWLLRLRGLVSKTGPRLTDDYSRLRICRGLYLYSRDGNPTDRTLIIGFSGVGHRLMLPTPVILRSLPADQVDVALVRTERASGYGAGIPGLGPSLLDSIAKLPELLGTERYAATAVLGTSAGGIPALVAARLLDAKSALAIGAQSLLARPWSDSPESTEIRRVLSAPLRVNDHWPHVFVMHSAGMRTDSDAARELVALIPGALPVAVAGSDHNCLLALLEHGRLRDELTRLLLTPHM